MTRERPSFKLPQVVGRIRFLTVAGLRSLSSSSCQQGTAIGLSQVLATWPLHLSQGDLFVSNPSYTSNLPDLPFCCDRENPLLLKGSWE